MNQDVPWQEYLPCNCEILDSILGLAKRKKVHKREMGNCSRQYVVMVNTRIS